MTTNQASKTNPIAKIISLLLALFLTSCSVSSNSATSTLEKQTEIPAVQSAGLELSATAPVVEPTPTAPESIPEFIVEEQLELQAKQNFVKFFGTELANITLSYEETTDKQGNIILRGIYQIPDGEQYSGEYTLITAQLVEKDGKKEWVQQVELTEVTQEQIDKARQELYIAETIDLNNI